MRNDIDGLNLYLQLYMDSNLHKDDKNKKSNYQKRKDILQYNLICTWIVETFINPSKINDRDKESKEGIRRIFDLFIDDPNADTITLSSKLLWF